MSLSYDLYQPGGSWLYRLDPRVKLFTIICASTLALACQNLWLVLAALFAVQAVLLSASIHWQTLAASWRVLWPLMMMILLFTALLTPGNGPQLFHFWIIHFSIASLAHGAMLAMRIALLAFIILAWLYTTDQAALTRSLVALGLPYPWGLTLAMALRYIPTLAATFHLIKDAQQARALELEHGNLLSRARAFIPIAVAMIITSLRTAESLSRALVSRGLGAPGARTNWRPLQMRPADWAWLCLTLVLSAAGLFARFALGLGAATLRLLD